MRPFFHDWLRYAAWTAVAVWFGAGLLALVYFVFITSLAGPISYFEVHRWQFSSWSIFILIAPTAMVLFKRIFAADGRLRWHHVLSVVLVACAAFGLHALWNGVVSGMLSPYPTLVWFRDSLGFHVRFGLPVDIAMITVIAVLASRAVVREGRLMAERALVASERRFTEFFENAVFGIYRSTPAGRFVALNRYAANALGYDSVDDAISSITDIGAQVYGDASERQRYLDAIQRDGSVENWIWKMHRRDGTVMWNSETARGVFDERGELAFIEGTVKDITREIEARDALQQSERRSAELRAQLADAQLHALKLQIKPHFLFNILNTIAMLIRTGDTNEARNVVTLLGSMFRQTLEFDGEHTVSLERELAFVESYLELERFRFADRLMFTKNVDAEVLSLHVPTLIVQPLVENAVKHGLAKMQGTCRISVMARRVGDMLEIEVANDVGLHASEGMGRAAGIGIRNTRARLRETFGDGADFELIPDGGRVRAVLRMPTGVKME
ncbi:MAG: histidine kinase [Gammaproteobacteria bacterium]